MATGAASAAFLVVTERHLGLVAFEPIAHLWTLWSISGAVILFSTQQWLAVSDRRIGGPVIGAVLVGSGLAAVFGHTFAEQLFGGRTVFWPLSMAAIPVGAFAMGVVRGTWARHNRFGGLTVVLLGENVIRLVGAIVLGLGVAAPSAFAIVLLSGFGAAFVFPRRQPTISVPAGPSEDEHRLLGAAAAVGLISHTAVNGGPTLLAVLGAPDAEVSRFFVVLTVARLPMLVSLAFVPRALVVFNRLVAESRRDELDEARLHLLVAGIGSAAAVFLASLLLGPWFIQVVFAVEAGAVEVALAASGLTLASASLIANTALVAERRVAFQLAAWGTPLALAVVGLMAIGNGSTLDILRALLLAELAIFVAVAVGARTRFDSRSTSRSSLASVE